MGRLEQVNRIALDHIVPKLVEQVFRNSPIVDFLRRNELTSVYACARRYGYESPYGTHRPYLTVEGWK